MIYVYILIESISAVKYRGNDLAIIPKTFETYQIHLHETKMTSRIYIFIVYMSLQLQRIETSGQ